MGKDSALYQLMVVRIFFGVFVYLFPEEIRQLPVLFSKNFKNLLTFPLVEGIE